MINKVGDFAERVATGLSRRRFFTYVGRGGLTLAAFLVGGLAAGHPPPPPPSPVASCTLNGGCCRGAFPYLRVDTRGFSSCSPDASCGVGYGCAASTCCNGGGACAGGTTCYSDGWCNTLC
jgi:hypothetical protein